MELDLLDFVRRITTFLLAGFLWLHALFLLNIQVPFIAHLSRFAHLSSSETILFVLLLLFSTLSASGFMKTLRSIAYIYFFPLVLLLYALIIAFRLLRGINRWFMKDQRVWDAPATTEQIEPAETFDQEIVAEPTPPKATPPAKPLTLLLCRPFKRFTTLWCILLLISTHMIIVWLSFVVVLCHLIWKIVGVLKVTVFSRSYIEKTGRAFFTRLDSMLEMLQGVNARTRQSKELENLWRQLDFWIKASGFLRNRYLVSRWAGLIVAAFFVCVYVYICLLFSFVYFGIGKVSGLDYPWSQAAVTALFLPAYSGDLPKNLAMRIVGGIQFTLIVGVGIGTFLNYLHKRIESVHSGAVIISDRLADKTVRAKLAALEKKIAKAKNEKRRG